MVEGAPSMTVATENGITRIRVKTDTGTFEFAPPLFSHSDYIPMKAIPSSPFKDWQVAREVLRGTRNG